MTDQTDPRSAWPTFERANDDEWVHEYRLPPADVLRDRYEHALVTRAGEASKLQWQAWRVYRKLIEAVICRSIPEDGRAGSMVDLEGELGDLVRGHILRRVEELQWAAENVRLVSVPEDVRRRWEERDATQA